MFLIKSVKHNLRYVLFWGSLSGAIRHDGFIPWNDDLDVAMPEEKRVGSHSIAILPFTPGRNGIKYPEE